MSEENQLETAPQEATGPRALALKEKPPELLTRFQTSSTQEKIQALIPKGMSYDRFAKLVVSIIYRQPELSQCDPVSFFSCIADCATMGMYPDPVTGKVYFIARRKKGSDKKVCTILVGFKGLRDLALQSPEILDIWPGVVRDGDKFSVVRAPRQMLTHEPDIYERGDVLGYYSCAALRSGLTSYEWIPLAEVERTRDRAMQGLEKWQVDQSPWTNYFDEMGKKTAIRRHFKSLPITETAREAMVVEEKVEQRTVKEADDGGSIVIDAAPAGRPEAPAPKGGMRAALEDTPPALPQTDPTPTPPPPPAPAPTPPPEQPKSTRRRTTQAETTPPAPAAPPSPSPAAGSPPPPAPPPAAPPPSQQQPLEIAPGITFLSYKGKPWPQVLAFELVADPIGVLLKTGVPMLKLQIKAEGYEGFAYSEHYCSVREIGTADGPKKEVKATLNILKPTALLKGTFTTRTHKRPDPADPNKLVVDPTKTPILLVSSIAAQEDETPPEI